MLCWVVLAVLLVVKKCTFRTQNQNFHTSNTAKTTQHNFFIFSKQKYF